MSPSAFINTPPANHRDYMIAKGMLLNAGITSDIRDPSKGVKLSPTRPEDYSFETKGPGIIAGLSICIFVMTAVTCLRLWLRFFVPRLKWGLDDTLIIPGLVRILKPLSSILTNFTKLMAIAYPSLQIAMVVHGGAGKHIFDVTYEEYYHYKWLANIAQIDFFVCVGIVKMSITAFNIRSVPVSERGTFANPLKSDKPVIDEVADYQLDLFHPLRNLYPGRVFHQYFPMQSRRRQLRSLDPSKIRPPSEMCWSGSHEHHSPSHQHQSRLLSARRPGHRALESTDVLENEGSSVRHVRRRRTGLRRQRDDPHLKIPPQD